MGRRFCAAIYAGTGMLLIRARRHRKDDRRYPDLRLRCDPRLPRHKTLASRAYALFESLIEDGAGIYLSEDFAFLSSLARSWRGDLARYRQQAQPYCAQLFRWQSSATL